MRLAAAARLPCDTQRKREFFAKYSVPQVSGPIRGTCHPELAKDPYSLRVATRDPSFLRMTVRLNRSRNFRNSPLRSRAAAVGCFTACDDDPRGGFFFADGNRPMMRNAAAKTRRIGQLLDNGI